MNTPSVATLRSPITLFLLALLASILTPVTSHAETSYYYEFYSDYLDPYLPEYPYRRMELMRKLHTASDSEYRRLKELLYQKDLDYLSQVSSILQLWKLRINNKWRSESLADVAEAAIFCLRNFDKDIDMGVSKEVGIIAHLQLQLFESPRTRDRAALIELLSELQKIKARNKFFDTREEYQYNLKQAGNADLKLLSERMTKEYIETLKKAFYGNRENLELIESN